MTYKEICLEKVKDGGEGIVRLGRHTPPAPVGTRFCYTFVSLTRDESLRRATAALLREHKGDDRLLWKVVA